MPDPRRRLIRRTPSTSAPAPIPAPEHVAFDAGQIVMAAGSTFRVVDDARDPSGAVVSYRLRSPDGEYVIAEAAHVTLPDDTAAGLAAYFDAQWDLIVTASPVLSDRLAAIVKKGG